MDIKLRVITNIEAQIFKNNIELNDGNEIFLSHIIDDLFCLSTHKIDKYNDFFTKKSTEKLNNFYEILAKMLISNELTGEGCFDHEQGVKTVNSVKNKINNYLSSNLNFILIKYSHSSIKPVSFLSYNDGYIWNVCTSKKHRGIGYMTLLFKHFISLLKKGEFKENIIIDDNTLSLNLLKKNPTFKTTKRFYFENGFKLKQETKDMIVLYLNIS